MQDRSVDLKLVNVSSTYPLNYSHAIDQNFFYFLFNINRPSTLEIFFELQIKPVVSIGPAATLQFQGSKKFERLNFTINYLLELPIENTTLQQIIVTSEKLLDFIETRLWKVDKEDHRVSIVYIVPDPNLADAFIIGLGSQYKEPFKMKRILLLLRSKGFDEDWEELESFKNQTKLNAVFWKSKSHLVNSSRAQPIGRSAYPLYQLNVTLQAVAYNETDFEELKEREKLLALSKANAGLITGSLVGFSFLEFLIVNSFWISIIWIAILVNTAITIACVYFNNNRM